MLSGPPSISQVPTLDSDDLSYISSGSSAEVALEGGLAYSDPGPSTGSSLGNLPSSEPTSLLPLMDVSLANTWHEELVGLQPMLLGQVVPIGNACIFGCNGWQCQFLGPDSVCNSHFSSAELLLDHFVTTHHAVKLLDKVFWYQCQVCGEVNIHSNYCIGCMVPSGCQQEPWMFGYSIIFDTMQF